VVEWFEVVEVQMALLVYFAMFEVGMSSIGDKGHYLGYGLCL